MSIVISNSVDICDVFDVCESEAELDAAVAVAVGFGGRDADDLAPILVELLVTAMIGANCRCFVKV